MSNVIVQTAFTAEPAVGRPGMPYDSKVGNDVITCIAQEAIPFGAFVRVSGGYCELPDTTTEVTAGEGGVALEKLTNASGTGYAAGDPVSVMRSGRVWVNAEQSIAAQADPFVRFAGTGAQGAMRNDADTANAVQAKGLSCYRGCTGAGLIVVQLNYPGTADH